MVDKNLKKLNRTELLELLLVQTKETERLREKLQRAEEALADRNLQVKEAGNLAQAALAVNGVMEAAQAAAQQYLDNIQVMQKQTELRCRQMIAQARQEAAQIRGGTVPQSAPRPQPPVQPEAPQQAKKLPETDQVLSDIYKLLDK